MNKLLFSDAAGPKWQKLYHQSQYAQAALIPATLISDKDSVFAKVADLGIAVSVPFHAQVGLNYVVSDYVPRPLQVPARVAVLGFSSIMLLGLLKTAVAGPGIGGAIKQLWTKESKPAQ